MRISTSQKYDTSTEQMNRTLEAYQSAQLKVSTGKSFNTLSDDPFAAMRSLNLKSIKSTIDQYSTNLESAKNTLNTSENALGQMSDLLKQAYTIAINGANSSTDQTSRNALATQISSIEEQLVNLGNTTGASGQYIFGGQKNSRAPFTASSGILTYNGDTNNITATVGSNDTVTLTTQIGSTLTNIYSQLESLKNNLSSGNVGTISNTDIANTQAGFDTLNQMRGDVGSTLQGVNNLITNNKKRSDDLTSSISDNEDVDLSKAISDMQLAQTAYQGALSVASSSMKLSLMDYIQ